nr:hypothetical protein [Tanacetum cinerariifolium]
MTFKNFMKLSSRAVTFSAKPACTPIDVGSPSVNISELHDGGDHDASSARPEGQSTPNLRVMSVDSESTLEGGDVADKLRKIRAITTSLEESSLKRKDVVEGSSSKPGGKLDGLSFDELTNVYDVYALRVAMIGNMLSKNGSLKHEVSKLDDDLSRAQNNQDVKGSQVVKDLRSESVRLSEELAILREVAKSSNNSRKELAEEVERLRPSIDKTVTHAIHEVHGLGSSWGFNNIADYNLEAEKSFDEDVEAFYKIEFPYVSMLVERDGHSLGELAVVEPSVIQEAASTPH